MTNPFSSDSSSLFTVQGLTHKMTKIWTKQIRFKQYLLSNAAGASGRFRKCACMCVSLCSVGDGLLTTGKSFVLHISITNGVYSNLKAATTLPAHARTRARTRTHSRTPTHIIPMLLCRLEDDSGSLNVLKIKFKSQDFSELSTN